MELAAVVQQQRLRSAGSPRTLDRPRGHPVFLGEGGMGKTEATEIADGGSRESEKPNT